MVWTTAQLSGQFSSGFKYPGTGGSRSCPTKPGKTLGTLTPKPPDDAEVEAARLLNLSIWTA